MQTAAALRCCSGEGYLLVGLTDLTVILAHYSAYPDPKTPQKCQRSSRRTLKSEPWTLDPQTSTADLEPSTLTLDVHNQYLNAEPAP